MGIFGVSMRQALCSMLDGALGVRRQERVKREEAKEGSECAGRWSTIELFIPKIIFWSRLTTEGLVLIL